MAEMDISKTNTVPQQKGKVSAGAEKGNEVASAKGEKVEGEEKAAMPKIENIDESKAAKQTDSGFGQPHSINIEV